MPGTAEKLEDITHEIAAQFLAGEGARGLAPASYNAELLAAMPKLLTAGGTPSRDDQIRDVLHAVAVSGGSD